VVEEKEEDYTLPRISGCTSDDDKTKEIYLNIYHCIIFYSHLPIENDTHKTL